MKFDITITDNHEVITDLERAKRAIAGYLIFEFCYEEEDASTFDDLTRVPIGFTEYQGKYLHYIQWYADLVRPRVFLEVDEEFATEQTFTDLEDLAEYFEDYDDHIYEWLVNDADNWIEENMEAA